MLLRGERLRHEMYKLILFVSPFSFSPSRRPILRLGKEEGKKTRMGIKEDCFKPPSPKAAGGCKLFDKSVIIGLWGVKGKKRNSSSGTVTEQIIA
jgi:hypothetical protein